MTEPSELFDLTPHEFLYHGTSESVASAIIDDGQMRPRGDSPEREQMYRSLKADGVGGDVADRNLIYLTDWMHWALLFGVGTALGYSWRHGHYLLNRPKGRKQQTSALVFRIPVQHLNPALCISTKYHRELAYTGNIPIGEGVQMLVFPLTNKLRRFAVELQDPEALKKYVGLDFMAEFEGEHLVIGPRE